MASGSARRRGLLPLAVLAVLVSEVILLGERPAVARGSRAAAVVAAVTAAYGTTGTLAVAVAKQHRPIAGQPLRGYEARRIRAGSGTADNGSPSARPFPTASMVKLFMAEDVLHRARTGELQLKPDDPTLLREMIRTSDDPAASALWVRYEGDGMVRDVAVRYGLTGTAPPPIPGQWGRTTTTARDLARFLSLLPVLAHPDDAAALLGWMREATARAADGFDQRFGLFGTAPAPSAVKQGWMCCVGGNRHLHSVGVIGSRVVVLLSEVPQTVGYDAARAALTAAAAAVPPRGRP
jgi:Beta-lactamase enzyme family